MSACWVATSSTWVCGWAVWNSRIAGATSGTVAAFTVPIRSMLRVLAWASAAARSRYTASSTSVIHGSSSRPPELIRVPVRCRSSSVTPSSRSRLPIDWLSAGWDMCSTSPARRIEPRRVISVRYSSCSIRMSGPRRG